MFSEKGKPFVNIWKPRLSSLYIKAPRSERRRLRGRIFDLIAAAKECSYTRDLEKGRRIHAQAVDIGQHTDLHLASALVNMYAKCGSLLDARTVFDHMEQRDVVTWNTLILGYVENAQPQEALQIYSRMLSQNCQPTVRTSVAALKACTAMAEKEASTEVAGKRVKLASLEYGMDIHSKLERSDIFVASALVNLYAKCGSLLDAQKVFDRMPAHDTVSWTSLMLGYADNDEEYLALDFFLNLPQELGKPDATLFVAALKACAGLAVKEYPRELEGKLVKVDALEKATYIHGKAAEAGYEMDLFVSSTLVDMYAKCRSMVYAQRIFDRMPVHNIVSWTSLMLGYTEIDEGEYSLELFSRMKVLSSSSPDSATYISALKAVTNLSMREEAHNVDGKLLKLACLEKGRAVHSQLKKAGLEEEIPVTVSLVDMYAKCGSTSEAREVFLRVSSKDIVAWTALALGYAENGDAQMAMEMFSFSESELDATAFFAVLKACCSLATKEQGTFKLASLEQGMKFHSLTRAKGFESNTFITNTLVDMYAKCGSTVDSRAVFDKMEYQTMASWNALLLGYVENGQEELAMELFSQDYMEPDSRTYIIALKACGSLVSLEKTTTIQAMICRSGAEDCDEVVDTTLVDIYGRCGSFTHAQHIFDTLKTRDLVSWTAMIASYSRAGDPNRVFEFFEEMRDDGFKANSVTLVCVLTACSRAGLVDKGKRYFEGMTEDYGVLPCVEHYACMVDILSRANKLDEAVKLAKDMAKLDGANAGIFVAWMSILGACWKWRNVAVGRIVFDEVVKIDDKQSAAYDLMANIYGNEGMSEERLKIIQAQQEIVCNISL